MRKKIVAGNWKMNLEWETAQQLFNAIQTIKVDDVQVVVFPSQPYLIPLINQNKSTVSVGSQNAYAKDFGAYTGETSFKQLKSFGVNYVLIGHSERREYFGETNQILKDKVDACLANEMTPVFCCGEPLEVRNSNEEIDFVRTQLTASLFHLSADSIKRCIIAYEPIWAIGTGLTATSDQAEAMHAAIRGFIAEKYDNATAESISILYGGSCNEKNAAELFACPNVDGGLIGGASLKYDSFKQIANSF